MKGDSLKLTESFVHVGRGPLEVALGYGHNMPENNTYVVAGVNPRGKIITIPKNKGFSSMEHWMVNEYPVLRPCLDVVPFDPATLLIRKGAAGNNYMFALMDISSGRMTDLDIPYPQDGVSDMSLRKVSAYEGHIRKRPLRRQFVHSTYSWPIVTIYDIGKNGAVKSTSIHNEVPSDYSDPANRSGYSVAVSSDYIFLGDPKLTAGDLRSGNTWKKNGFGPGYSNEWGVYDWDGRPIAKLHLSEAISFCSVDKNSRYLYGIAQDAESFEYHFVRYDLKGAL